MTPDRPLDTGWTPSTRDSARLVVALRQPETFADIRVVGVGGAGCNAVTRMIEGEVRGVRFLAVNTDQQALLGCGTQQRLQIGEKVTKGLGAGGNPAIGARAAEDSAEELREALRGADLVFLAAGMGGGTGTGATPIIAQLARGLGALAVAAVTRPFGFEGARRRAVADEGLAALRSRVDTLITIPNDRLLAVAGNKTSVLQAFRLADDVLRQGVQGISDLITVPGLINVDFADVRAILAGAGSALMAIGHGCGETRAPDAARAAIASPLLEVAIEGARGILFNVTGGADLSLHEVNEAATLITQAAHPEANIIFGAVIDPTLQAAVHITVIATGFEGPAPSRERAGPRARLSRDAPGLPTARPLQARPQLPPDVDERDVPPFLRPRR